MNIHRVALLAAVSIALIGRSQAQLIPVSLEMRIANAAVIIEAEVISRSCFLGENGRIYTGYRLEVHNNTLICEGTLGRILEVDSIGQTVWEYVCPVNGSGPMTQGDATNATNSLFRAYRYTPDYPGLAGRVLVPGLPIELNPLPLPPSCGGTATTESSAQQFAFTVSPNPARSGRLQLVASSPHHGRVHVQLFDAFGQLLHQSPQTFAGNTLELPIEVDDLTSGSYWLRIQAAGQPAVKQVTVKQVTVKQVTVQR